MLHMCRHKNGTNTASQSVLKQPYAARVIGQTHSGLNFRFKSTQKDVLAGKLTFLAAFAFLALALGLAATPFGLAADAFLALGLAAAGAAFSPSAEAAVVVSAFFGACEK